MGLVGVGIVFVLFAVLLVAGAAITVVAGLIVIILRLKKRQSVKAPLMIVMGSVASVALFFLYVNYASQAPESNNSKQYQDIRYTIWLPSKLPAGYKNLNHTYSSTYSLIDLGQAKLLELASDSSSSIYNPASTCAFKMAFDKFVNHSETAASTSPCLFIGNVPHGYPLYEDAANPDYGGTILGNTLIIIYRQDLAHHVSDVFTVLSSLKTIKGY